MKGTRNIIIYAILLVVQVLICNYANLSQYIVLSFLPALVLCLPVQTRPLIAMVAAFAMGLAVDFFSTGMLGLMSVALVPVAASRRLIIRIVFGQELFARNENINIHRHGLPKLALAVLISQALYFIIFTVVDCAGTRSFWFCLLRTVLSVLVSTLVSVLVAAEITSEG